MSRKSINFKQWLLNTPGVLPALTFAALIGSWEAACHLFSIPPFVLPAPSTIADGFGSINAARWFEHIWSTLRVAFIGYFMSIVIAIPIASESFDSPPCIGEGMSGSAAKPAFYSEDDNSLCHEKSSFFLC